MTTKKRKVLVVFGTRPDAIKMAPLVLELRKRTVLDVKVCVSGQHREMLQQVLDVFQIEPDYDLKIMQPGQTLFDITTRTINALHPVLQEYGPDIVLVHGDTSTGFATSLAAFYLKICVGHVEAGLRANNANNIFSPFPEEYNRRAISIMSKFNFAPTQTARDNLKRENCPPDSIFITGNTAIDVLCTPSRIPITASCWTGLREAAFWLLRRTAGKTSAVPCALCYKTYAAY